MCALPSLVTVYALPVTRYSYIEPGRRSWKMADLSKLQVRAYFDEPEIGDLQLNNPVSIVWDAKPDMKFHGRITRLPSNIITYGTRNVGEVLVSVEDSNGVLSAQHQCCGHGHHPPSAQCADRAPGRRCTSRVDAIPTLAPRGSLHRTPRWRWAR